MDYLTLICSKCRTEFQYDVDNQRCPKCNERYRIFIEQEEREHEC